MSAGEFRPYNINWAGRIFLSSLGSRPAPQGGSEPAQLATFNRHVVVTPDRDWREAVAKRLQELMALPVGWDGYRAKPVNYLTVDFAMRMLESICPSETSVPHLIPGVDGDLQIEWHTAEEDIELHVRQPNSVHAWRRTAATGEDGEEVELSFVFWPIIPWIKELNEATANADSAAA